MILDLFKWIVMRVYCRTGKHDNKRRKSAYSSTLHIVHKTFVFSQQHQLSIRIMKFKGFLLKKCYMKFGVWNQMKIWSSHLLDILSNCLMNLKNSGDSTGFEPMKFESRWVTLNCPASARIISSFAKDFTRQNGQKWPILEVNFKHGK